MATALELTQEELELYRAAARRRQQHEQHELAQREQKAWILARQAAALLQEQFGVNRVAVFGSLSHPGCFTPWSDVDIAAWGIPPTETFRAIGAVMDLDSEIEINLVDVQTCSASLLRIIEREGIQL